MSRVINLAAIVDAAQDVLEASHDQDLPLQLRVTLDILERALIDAGLRNWLPDSPKDETP